MLIDIIAGARPNFVKIAPIIAAIQARANAGEDIRFRLIHTGQHYDPRLSGMFFDQLAIPQPDHNLEVGSGTQAEQTGAIMQRYEAVLMDYRPDLCLVVGDVTSTMACAITAQKMHVAVGHVEGGIRSGDWTMPEEINRLATDAVTDWFFTTSKTAGEALRQSGVPEAAIHFVGNTMIDTLLTNRSRFKRPECWDALDLTDGNFIVVTMHRPANVDQADELAEFVRIIADHARGLPVVFPVHPRTAKTLEKLGELPGNLHCIEPLSYLEFNFLVERARIVITDSGGITEEATVLGVPCMTLRDTTERPETVTMGTNELVGTDPAVVPAWLDRLFKGEWKQGNVPPLWDGKAAERIVDILLDLPDRRSIGRPGSSLRPSAPPR
ncbi:UDP-N-acetylglucosamine 2-epimerase (non-hydrolyzing) [Tsuneonella sp. YG55]|uniref:UDP-N-acetylglucosamine 2-epimerase (Non-hydrolyzing) n=1 Tax=Tsuneonella litorea TaxID=2976475 RepID=A0A9X2VYU3_9SPHN|nr:UDP-N-acetylglucosamine 2-epimerase (non-hydrolyzing) [Tsuneonella litorea]MCT2557798.1 UDP-N-acetylglucosamine 2-epimerase (non-hydrolyzing) [Tsuneonella litorea]